MLMETNEDDKSKVKTFLGFGAMDDYQNNTNYFNTDQSVNSGNKEGCNIGGGDNSTATTNVMLDGQTAQLQTEIKMEVVTVKQENESPQETIR